MTPPRSAARDAVRVVLLGPPGAGKGTQAELLSKRLGVPTISTGDIFRTNIAAGTPLGLQAQAYTDRGALVPDELTDALVRDRLTQADVAEGFLLDGYPRNLAQARQLEVILADLGADLDLAVELAVPADVVVERLLQRAQVEGRADDTEDVIRHRLEVYAQETAPIAELYVHEGLLAVVDGLGSVEEVAARVAEAVEPVAGPVPA